MEYKKLDNDHYVMRLNKGEEVIEQLKIFATNENVLTGEITGIGASNKVEIGLFNTETKVPLDNFVIFVLKKLLMFGFVESNGTPFPLSVNKSSFIALKIFELTGTLYIPSKFPNNVPSRYAHLSVQFN